MPNCLKMNKHELENLEPLLGQMISHLKIIQRDKNSHFLSLMVSVKITVCKWERFEKTEEGKNSNLRYVRNVTLNHTISFDLDLCPFKSHNCQPNYKQLKLIHVDE